jgi:N-hydroxyarylamine O-acetyltransferase
MVANRRGGCCFEHNLLLASALEHLGLRVEPILARVRFGGAPPEARPAGHLMLRVTDEDGRRWHADVGFGLGTLLEPIPFGPSGVHEQAGWNFQVRADGEELVLQTSGSDGWSDV